MTEIDELLKEWAFFFRDRRNRERCKSIESRFQPHSEDFAKEGWGDMDATPSKPKNYLLLRALRTHEALQSLPKIQKWAITYYFCYPHLPRGMVLRCMKKWVGERVSWKVYTEQVEIGKLKVHAVLMR